MQKASNENTRKKSDTAANDYSGSWTWRQLDGLGNTMRLDGPIMKNNNVSIARY